MHHQQKTETVQDYLQQFLTEISTKWNSGQKMALLMLLISAEILNFLAWMVYVEFSNYAQDYVNLVIIERLLPLVIVAFFIFSVNAYLFYRFRYVEKFIKIYEPTVMILYSLGMAYVGYLVGYDNLISVITVTSASVLIILLCHRSISFGLAFFNIMLMFFLMYVANAGLIPQSALHVGEVHSKFWVYSYLQLCAFKLILILNLVGNFIFAIKKSYANSKHLSEHDGLTGLPNRSSVIKYLNSLIQKQVPIGLVMIDLDYFKQINDNLGHVFGDKVLVEVGQCFKKTLREDDMLGRYGGEEFILVIANADNNIANIVAQRLHKMMNQLEISINETQSLKPTASFGITTSAYINSIIGEENQNLTNQEYRAMMQKQLIEVADVSMYHAKKTGRNKLVNAVELPKGSFSIKNQSSDKTIEKLNIVSR